MTIELLSAAERDAIVATHIRKHLQALGFTPVNARSWIDGSQVPARRMFELRLLKGACMKACWGFSLNFVPHISGGRVCWHRSDKTARLDVIVDPGEKLVPKASYIHGASGLHNDLTRLLPTAVEKAKETWQRGQTVRGLLDLIRELREHKTNSWPFDTYTQLPLAYAFLSAKLGDVASAKQELDRYISRSKLNDETAAKLKKLALGQV